MLLIRLRSYLQFEVVLAAYKKKSRLWNPTLNKFAEGRLPDQVSTDSLTKVAMCISSVAWALTTASDAVQFGCEGGSER